MMEINYRLIQQVAAAGAQLVVVTKYWNSEQTEEIIKLLENQACVLGWGENRTQALETKHLPPDKTHFIGRLQSRQLPIIVQYCHTIHSLASLKHAQKIHDLVEQNNYSKIKVFIQVNVAKDPHKEGIEPSEVPHFLASLSDLKLIEVVGLASMGWGEFEESDKRQEFKDLLALRKQYLPNGKTSAGTSRDYPLALEEGIDIVRIGQGILV